MPDDRKEKRALYVRDNQGPYISEIWHHAHLLARAAGASPPTAIARLTQQLFEVAVDAAVEESEARS